MSEKIVHRGVRHERVKTSIAEAVYAAMWEKTNEGRPGINSGCGTLRLILNRNEKANGLTPWVDPDSITQRDAQVAATVIQWLGTNVGRNFLEECKTEIDKALAVSEKIVTEHRKRQRP